MKLPYPEYPIEFTKNGDAFDRRQVEAALGAVRAADGPGAVTDLYVISHGWNNDVADATSLYERFFQKVDEMAKSGLVAGLDGRVFAVACVFWPSKKFTDAELIPGGGAASAAAAAGDAATVELLTRLQNDPERLGQADVDPAKAAPLNEAIALLPALEGPGGAGARARFVRLVREAVGGGDASHPDDGSDAFFTAEPEHLFTDLDGAVQAPPPKRVAGGAAALRAGGGGAAGLKDMLSGIRSAARRIANFATYYQMKKRGGTVGSRGLAPVLRALRDARPDLKVHLIGHSFGARVVTAAADALPAGTPRTTMTLLQGAYSHNGLSKNFDGAGGAGFFHKLVEEWRISGPIVITHTKNDKAVGVAYPLASRIARDRAAALGDRDDPFGGIGRNGALHTAGVDDAIADLRDLGEVRTARYGFRERAIYNLNADPFIGDHSDICKHEVAAALLSAVASV